MEEEEPLIYTKKTVDCPEDKEGCFGTRHVLAIMTFLAFFNLYCMRVNLSVAMVAMVNVTEESDNSTDGSQCEPPAGKNTTKVYLGEQFNWDEHTQGILLGSFFYGYIVTMFPGGYIAQQIGGKRLLGIGVFCTSVLTLLTPLAAKLGVGAFIALRVLEGLGEGVTTPSNQVLWGHWAPVMERSKMVSISLSGALVGTVVSMPLSGVLCESQLFGGWPSVFYLFGGLGCVWCVFWVLLIHEKPEQHPRISTAELQYIQNSIGTATPMKTPLKAIFTSPPVWATCAANFSNNWGFYTMLTCLPTYLKRILKFNIADDGFLSAVPYTVGSILMVVTGYLTDFIRGRGYLSTGATRKCIQTFAFLVPAIVLSLMDFAGCNHVLVVAMVSIAVAVGNMSSSGFMANQLDIAPNFAGILVGISNTFGTIPGFLGPYVVGQFTNNDQTRGQWQIVFYISAGIYVAGAVIYFTFASGVEQPWNRPDNKEQSINVSPNANRIEEKQ